MLNDIKLVTRWWKTWKTIPVLSWVFGACLYSKGRYAQAAEHYQKGLEKHPNHPAQYCARLDLAYCYFRNGQFSEAEEQLKIVTAKVPESREGYLRLARLQIWTGRSLEASWTMRRALRSLPADGELAATFLLAVLDNEGPEYLLNEAVKISLSVATNGESNPRLDAARARLAMLRGDRRRGRARLEEIVSSSDVSIEAILLFAEVLIEEERIAHARRELRRALKAAPRHPRVLSLLAESYLKSGPFYNTEFAQQLAIQACQASNWMSPREMHILAECYYHHGDKISALLIASKAKDLGSKLLGEYRGVKHLDRLIETLSTGTQA